MKFVVYRENFYKNEQKSLNFVSLLFNVNRINQNHF